MIYRKWSLLSSTVVIWGGVASLGLAQFFLFGGKAGFDPKILATTPKALINRANLEKLHDYLCSEGARLRQLDRAKITAEKLA